MPYASSTLATRNRTRPRIVLLNGFQLVLGGAARPVPLGVQRLLALLALRPDAVPRSNVRGILWPDVGESAANGRLRTALWRAGRLHDGLVETSPTCLRLAGDVLVDTHETVALAHRLLTPADVDTGELIQPALTGELLPGWYDDWVLFERERLGQLMLHALEALAVRLLALGRYGSAADAAYAAIRADPLRESAQQVLIRVHLAEGNVREAVRRYRAYAGLLRDELALAPSAALTELVFPAGGQTSARHRAGGNTAGGDVRSTAR
ncbi:BTAD domain-containing putative transcriptional regulator [Frankia sp. CiP1_Cm_nod2]|uniref:BTAD domain-containing putative transcriptional regulator n=1 Tax=Frankia sp. CiP1_Cm_nod2 TaxID=2897161 RepID=UPI002025AB75